MREKFSSAVMKQVTSLGIKGTLGHFSVVIGVWKINLVFDLLKKERNFKTTLIGG